MPAKRLLLVDDHREVTRMLRTALETLGRGYTIVDVPSGEEAVLELGRGGIDLLIADVRLPGISGLEVAKRFRKANPKGAIIIITGQPNVPEEVEAQRLGALGYFAKPLRMDNFMAAVFGALGEKPPERPVEAAPAPSQDEPSISTRLSTLRRDLGANAVFLVDQDGKIVVRAGDVMRLDMEAVIPHLMTVFSGSMKVCKLLGGLIPSNVQFFDGDDFDIYSANVGQFFTIVIIFDGDRGAGQMGPVMRYGRQCADDLLNSLVMMGMGEAGEPEFMLATPTAAPAAPPPSAPAKPAAPAPRAPLPKEAPPAPRAAPVMAPPPPVQEIAGPPLTEAELKALDEAARKVSSDAAASFWDAALTEAEATDVRPDALSFEQAEKLGLIPKN
jgi:DNA-binding response OmpR family regulator